MLMLMALTTGLFVPYQVKSQPYPSKFEIGKPCPAFTLNQVEQYQWTSFTPSREKGKWLLLNFFSMGCASSFSSLQKLDSLNRVKGVPLKVILIGRREPTGAGYPDIREEYRQFQEKYRLSMPVGYSETVFRELGITSAPYSVLVDPVGVVRAIFYINTIQKDSLIDFILGKTQKISSELDLPEAQAKESAFDFRSPLLLHGNGGKEDAFLFRSVLTAAIPQGAPNPVAIQRGYGSSIQFINAPLRDLLYIAFGDTVSKYPKIQPNSYGKYYPEPIWDFALSAADSLRFVKQTYCYSLQVPVPYPHPFWIQQIMQADLQQYFGLRVTVEDREMPCYVLRLMAPKEQFLTKGGVTKKGQQAMGRVVLQNAPMSALIQSLWGRYQQDTLFIDETGITEPIDLTFNTLLTDPLTEAITDLRQQGIDLHLTKRRMKVFVVKPASWTWRGKD